MAAVQKEFSLEAVKTDGWFERIGEGIGSFHALCEIVGERFFAFSIIVGARITALTVDRRSPAQSLVDFVVGGPATEAELEPQRLTLGDFRRRLVAALLVEDEVDPKLPQSDSDVEGLQVYLGVRYLLLAPLYGYSLQTLRVSGDTAQVAVSLDGEDETLELEVFRRRLRALVHDELDRASASNRSAIDLSKVAEAENYALRREWPKVVALLGSWPAPLAIFLRTPEGQMLAADARSLIAKGLGLLGTACVELGEIEQSEEVFRIGIQYAQEGASASDLFKRLGAALLQVDRPGEAIGPLRRAAALGGKSADVYQLLGRAFAKRGRFVAAYGCFREATAAGLAESELQDDLIELEAHFGPALTAWKAKLVKT